MHTIDIQTTAGHAMCAGSKLLDRRPGVRHLSQEKIDRCIVDAARSTSSAGLFGSSAAAMIAFSEACYPDGPNGRGCGQN
jgi:hypothetical protein